MLSRVGIECEECGDLDSALGTLRWGAGAVIAAEEALTPEKTQALASEIARQPAWSDLPIILLTVSGEVTNLSLRRSARRRPLGNVLLLERPIRPETLISTVQSALRARRRQYDMRDQLEGLHKAQQALVQNEKLAVAGRLAASIAHEINNPLEAVTNLIYLARTAEFEKDRAEYLIAAERELARVSEITNQTLMFYRQPAAPGPTDVTAVLDSVLSLYHGRLHNSDITIEKDFERVLSITASGGELRQLFANLIGNSLDAMRAGGKLVLRLRSGMGINGSGISNGVRVTIADNGSGIPPAIKRKAFEPFVTTKGNTGTGLGLWVSSEIVRKHGGTVRLRSSVTSPSGTVVSVFLPAMHR